VRKLRAGVIGCGPIAQRGHLPALKKSSRVEVAAVADVDSKALEATSRKFHVPSSFSDYQAMLDEKLDLVSICVPNHLHAKVAIDALKRGAHVLVEKPLAVSSAEAEMVVKTAETEKLKVCEAKQWRYVPPVRRALKMFSEGKLGKLVSMIAQWHSEVPLTWSHADWYYDPAKSGGGIVSDLGVHMLDLLLLFGGPVARVTASGGDYLGTMGFDTSVQALLEFSGGGSGFLDVSWIAPPSKVLEIVGTAGNIQVDMHYYSFKHTSYARNPLKDFRESINTIGRTGRRIATKDFFNPLPRLYSELIDDFADAIMNDKPSPVPGDIGLRVLRLKEAIYQSISAKNPVTLA